MKIMIFCVSAISGKPEIYGSKKKTFFRNIIHPFSRKAHFVFLVFS
jgi:hypothetical protein